MTPNRLTHLVVDGSNIATEGRSAPSLAQLDEAVRAILDEFPHERLTVVVDATFGHRIADSERAAYEEAILAGEIVAPPAGAVGRGDAFILQVADKAGATVFSNDSFQEFHGQHEWLFDEGRLIGGKPVPGVGWVFVNRVPVRGPTSRRATRQSKRGSRVSSPALAAPETSKAIEEEIKARRSRPRPRGVAIGVTKAPGAPPSSPPAAVEPEGQQPRSPVATQEALNEPHVFLAFIAKNRIGSTLDATVDHFSSHGAYVVADGARCYLPTKTMGDPPPNRARDLIGRGDVVRVEVQSLDAQRRGVNVRFIEVAARSQADPAAQGEMDQAAEIPLALTSADEADDVAHQRSELDVATTKSTAKRSTVKKAPSGRAAKKATTKKATTKKAAAEATPSPRATKAAAKKATTKKAATKRAATTKKATATKATATKATAKKSAAKRSVAKKSTAGTATTKKAAATKATSNKSAATKATATKKATAKKATAKKAAAKRTSGGSSR